MSCRRLIVFIFMTLFCSLQLEVEYDKISIWLKRHVSDHSAINHQHQVALLLVAATTLPDPLQHTLLLLGRSLGQSMQVLHSSGCGGHASLWSLRRLWVQTLLGVLRQQCFGRREVCSEEERGAGVTALKHGFDVCFSESAASVTAAGAGAGAGAAAGAAGAAAGMAAGAAATTEVPSVRVGMRGDEDALVYLAAVQKKALGRIAEHFDGARSKDARAQDQGGEQEGEEGDSYIGLSSSPRQSGRVQFSRIEIELDLPRLLSDGVTYRAGGWGGGREESAGGDDASSLCKDSYAEDKEEEEEEDDDEVTASLQLHSRRLSALMQRLPALVTQCTDPTSSTRNNVLAVWLSQFITEEILFCGTCISTSGWYTSNCWDPQKQKVCALEYCIFVIYQVSQSQLLCSKQAHTSYIYIFILQHDAFCKNNCFAFSLGPAFSEVE
jgi:hypothetical protein